MSIPQQPFRLLPILVVLSILFSPACALATPLPLSPTPAPTDTPQPTATFTPLSPTATPTPSPTATPVPTDTPTATETPALSPFELTKGPLLLYTGQNTAMRLFWQWTEKTTFRVDWGLDGSYSLGSADVAEYDTENHLYAFDITGLQSGTLYHYRVVLNRDYAAGSFYTAPPTDAQALKFVSYGDTRTNPDQHDAVAGQVLQLFRSDPAYQTFVLSVGDFVSRGDSEDSWATELFSPSLKNIHALFASLCILPVMGNHEGSGALFLRYFGLPFVAARYGSFDYGPAHIILLDQYVDYSPGSAENQWLAQDLSASTKPWKLVVLHEPGWSAAGAHLNNPQVQDSLQPLFRKTGVQVVFAGHNHYYARAEVDGVTHLTIGTGGAPLYMPVSGQPGVVTTYQGTGFAKFEIQGDALSGTFIAADGTVKDSFTIKR